MPDSDRESGELEVEVGDGSGGIESHPEDLIEGILATGKAPSDVKDHSKERHSDKCVHRTQAQILLCTRSVHLLHSCAGTGTYKVPRNCVESLACVLSNPIFNLVVCGVAKYWSYRGCASKPRSRCFLTMPS